MYTDTRELVTVAPKPIEGFGFLAAVDVIDVPNSHQLMGAEYMSDSCTWVSEWGDLCYVGDVYNCDGTPPTPPTGGFKQFANGPVFVEGGPFVLESGIECPTIGMPDSEALERVSNGYDYGEGLGVDTKMIDVLAANGAAPIPGVHNVVEGLGQLADFSTAITGALATWVMPRSVALAAFGEGLILLDGSRFVSPFGNPVVAYGLAQPLPIDAVHPAYVTGPITILRGPKDTKIAPETVLPDSTCVPRRALCERMYVPLIECGAGYEVGISLAPTATP